MDQNEAALKAEIIRRTRAWDQRFQQMEEDIRRQDEALAQARNRTEMALYIDRRKAEEVDTIAPELMSFVGGRTTEEVEQSIARAQAKTASIVQGPLPLTCRTSVR